MMSVKLVRRWGPHSAGRTVQVDDEQGVWLIRHNYAQTAGEVLAPDQVAAAEGGHGADPLAGGDATRRRPQVTQGSRNNSSNVAQAGPGVPPVFRAGFTADHRGLEGEAGRHHEAPAQAAEGSKKPVRRRSKSDS
jgi:hypothetical protein